MNWMAKLPGSARLSRIALAGVLLLALLCGAMGQRVGETAPAGAVGAMAGEGGLLFIENVGQYPPAVRFYARQAETALWLTAAQPAADAGRGESGGRAGAQQGTTGQHGMGLQHERTTRTRAIERMVLRQHLGHTPAEGVGTIPGNPNRHFQAYSVMASLRSWRRARVAQGLP